MPSVNEKIGTPLEAALEGGIKNISYDASVQFKEYERYVLPLDGFIFWIATGKKKRFKGSLHYLTESIQEEAENYDLSRILFTSKREVRTFHEITYDKAWVGTQDNIKFVIGSTSYQYEQAGIYHYIGESLSPAFEGQFVDTPGDLPESLQIVSNSLPIFLSMRMEGSPYLEWCPWPDKVPIFPSFLIPDNQPLPYITVHNDANSVRGRGMSSINPYNTTGMQITSERVRLSLYGLNNLQAGNLREYVLRWALIHPHIIGIMNNPIIRDEKQFLPDISILAQKKTIDFEVMYAQIATRDFIRQVIKHATSSIEVKHATNSHN